MKNKLLLFGLIGFFIIGLTLIINKSERPNKQTLNWFNGNLEEASLLAENLLRQKLSNQEHVGLLNVLGSIHAINKKFEKARENFQAALDIDDGNIDTNYNLAKVLTNMNNNSLALKYYEKILKLRNDHAPSFNNMGDIYLSLKNYEKAEMFFKDYRILANNFQIPSMINIYLNPEQEASCLSIGYHETLYSFIYKDNFIIT